MSASQDSDMELLADVSCDQASFAAVPCVNVVSLQSTSRPGCIVELAPIDDAIQVSHSTLSLSVLAELKYAQYVKYACKWE